MLIIVRIKGRIYCSRAKPQIHNTNSPFSWRHSAKLASSIIQNTQYKFINYEQSWILPFQDWICLLRDAFSACICNQNHFDCKFIFKPLLVGHFIVSLFSLIIQIIELILKFCNGEVLKQCHFSYWKKNFWTNISPILCSSVCSAYSC